MEHRYNSRTPISLDVLLYYQGLPVTIGKTRDIGLGGMSVDASKAGALPKNAAVEVELLHHDAGKRARLPAYVVHKSRNGIGLLFSKVSQRAINTIQELTREKPAANE